MDKEQQSSYTIRIKINELCKYEIGKMLLTKKKKKKIRSVDLDFTLIWINVEHLYIDILYMTNI